MSDTVRLTEEFRGGLLDLTHYGYISIVDEKGKVIYSAGDPEAMVFYRSASKPVQARCPLSRITSTKNTVLPMKKPCCSQARTSVKASTSTL